MLRAIEAWGTGILENVFEARGVVRREETVRICVGVLWSDQGVWMYLQRRNRASKRCSSCQWRGVETVSFMDMCSWVRRI